MRTLSVHDVIYEMSEEVAEQLLASEAIYECGDEHDLHLNPIHKFDLYEVETLLDL
jgi:hypothetical protein